MTYFELEKSAKHFYPVIALDALFSRKMRAGSLIALTILVALLGIVAGASAIPAVYAFFVEQSPDLVPLLELARSVFFLALPFLLALFAAHSFGNSFYFSGFDNPHSERFSDGGPLISYEVAAFFYGADAGDITESFIRFNYGYLLLLRLGLSKGELEHFLANRQTRMPAEALSVDTSSADGKVRFYDLAIAIFKLDKEFAQFLFGHGVQQKNFQDATRWVSRDILAYKKRQRWWSRDRLGRIEGIGKDWAYGTAYRLRRYSTELTSVTLPPISSKPRYIQSEVERLETVLSKTREANALLVGEDGGSKLDVLKGFANKVQEGDVFAPLAHKKIYLFDGNRLVGDTGEKTKFEFEFIKMLDEAVAAGDVILVIEDFPAFLQSVAHIGSNAQSILSPYLMSSAIQLICLSNPMPFHQIIEPDTILLSRFDVLMLKEGESTDIMETLEDEATSIEAQKGIFIPQPTLALIAESADRYITEGVMPDKAIDLLYEITAFAARTGKERIGRGEVLAFIKTKTGIPTGEVTGAEKDKLINLETLLHARVIGQEEAVTAIANAMRRARSGVSSPNRPMGSFLFMGPTGVGKTETTKALAEAFFGDESRILRLDMSEYKTADALNKLIGSFESNSPGVLTSMLREHPYGVLLLDEFEKTTKDVMDLFLQILDEGAFSDMHGKKVNARNLIIIATSNAGSELVWQYVQQGINPVEKKNEIVDAVVSAGIFRPELLNRFDGVIIFQPINDTNLKEVARLMLEKFRSRLRERGIDLEITDDLLNYLVRFGSDPKFGARPMNRAIQDVVEQKVADKIIKGEVAQGAKISLTAADLS